MPYVCIRLDVLTHSCVFTCAEAQNFMMSESCLFLKLWPPFRKEQYWAENVV